MISRPSRVYIWAHNVVKELATAKYMNCITIKWRRCRSASLRSETNTQQIFGHHVSALRCNVLQGPWSLVVADRVSTTMYIADASPISCLDLCRGQLLTHCGMRFGRYATIHTHAIQFQLRQNSIIVCSWFDFDAWWVEYFGALPLVFPTALCNRSERTRVWVVPQNFVWYFCVSHSRRHDVNISRCLYSQWWRLEANV